MRPFFYTELEEPPFVDADDGEVTGRSIMKMHRLDSGFLVSLNLLAWQSFRWYLWLLVTTLPLHEDISIETDNSNFTWMKYQTVPFSEIMLVGNDERVRNSLGSNHCDSRARVDFYVTREEALEAYRRFCSMTDEADQPRAICTKLFDNLWVQFAEHAHTDDIDGTV